MTGLVTRLPLLPISFLLASVSVGALVFQRTRPVETEPIVQLDRVGQAVATTSSAKSFAFTYSATISAAGGSVTVSGGGSVDLERKLAAMKLRVNGATAGSPAAQFEMDLVLDSSDGLIEYIHMPLLDGRLPAGKSWVKVDVGALGKKQGIDLSALKQGDRADPAKFFTFLRRAANPTAVGKETVGGVATTHYQATVDLRRLAAIESDRSEREALQRAIELSGISSYPVDAWIDGAGYLRRMRIAMPLQIPGSTTTVGTMTMTEELSNFGDPVDVAVPPEASVVDVTDLAGSN